MIELTMEEFVLWAVCVPLLGIGIYSAVAGYRRRARARQARHNIIRCRVCGHLYQDRSRERFPPCPECRRPNDRGRSRRLG